MLKVRFYTKDNCSLCEDVYALLKLLEHDYRLEIEEIDIYKDMQLLEMYQLLIPAVQIRDTFLNCEEINLDTLERAMKEG